MALVEKQVPPQTEFAEHIEDNLDEIVSPPGAQMLEMAQLDVDSAKSGHLNLMARGSDPFEHHVIPATRELLEHFTREALRDYARGLGLPHGKAKQEIIERLLDSAHVSVIVSLGD